MPAPPPSVAIEPLTSLHCTAEVIPPEAEVTRRSFAARGGGFFAGEWSAGPDRGFYPLNLWVRPSLRRSVCRYAAGEHEQLLLSGPECFLATWESKPEARSIRPPETGT